MLQTLSISSRLICLKRIATLSERSVNFSFHTYFRRKPNSYLTIATVNAATARIIPTSQRRITIVSSGHPIASRWWWNGAIRNIFLPFLKRFETSWRMTEIVSKMNIPPAMRSTRRVSVIHAMTARVAPREREPTSPMKTRAGRILNQRKAMSAPTITRQNAVRMKSHFVYAITA